MKQTIKKLVAGAALVLGAFGAIAAEPIKIGSVLSVTGPAAFLGDPELKTLQQYVEEINKKGGVIGRPLQLVHYDDGSDANKANGFAKRLIDDDKVDVMVGGTTTGATMSMVPLVEKAGVPFISLAGAVVIVEPVKKHVFKTPHTDRMACQKIFEDMQKRGITKVGMISGTDGFGASMQAQCKSVAPDYAIEIVADETYDPKDADMTAQLTKIKNTEGVQAVLNPGFGQGPSIVTRNYKQLAIDLPFYQSHGVASDGFIELAGADAAEGVRLPGTALLVADLLAEDDPQKPVVMAYKTMFEEKTGTPVGTFGGYAHDAFLILTDALGRAGSAEPAAIRDAIEATTGLAGTTGIYSFTAEDHLGLDLSAFRMLEIKGGEWTLVD